MRDTDHYLFYAEQADSGHVHLSADEARHATRVLRLSPGKTLRATNGAGVMFECRLSTVHQRGAECEVLSTIHCTRPLPRVDMYVGLPERDAFERMLEEVAALGIEHVRPLVCDYCQKAWWAHRWDKLRERFNRKLVVAMKQSLQPFLPVVCEPVSFETAVRETALPLVVGVEDGALLPAEAIARTAACESVAAVVGPPGGFSPSERALLDERRALTVRLSPNRLRTELAATLLSGILLAPRDNR